MTKILIIEDEQPLREELLDWFQFEGFDVFGAQDGRTGIQRACDLLPDLIICDISMPEMDGYGVLMALREDPRTAPIPFVFLTARAEQSFVRHGMELGADDFLTKPVTRAELFAAVRARLDRHKATSPSSPLELEQAKKKIARLVAHELRTPLASITMAQSMISRQIGKLSPHELQELLNTQSAGSRRLERLVEQMVMIARFDLGVSSQETILEQGFPMQIQQLLAAAISFSRRFAYRNHDADINLSDHAEHAEVLCDSQFLKHGLAELITNALNFSPEDGEVVIYSRQTEDTVQIIIEDKGPGIPQDQLEQVTQDFQQIGRETQEQQGMGLGLPLAQRIIEAHGGTLELNSGEGEGMQVLVNLPLAIN
jgi:two-component system, sensor histidine kinase and response regulator